MTEKVPKGIPILEFDDFCENAACMAIVDYREAMKIERERQQRADENALIREAKTAMKSRIIAHLKKRKFAGDDKAAEEFADRQIEKFMFYCSNGIVEMAHLCSTSKYYISNDANEQREEPFEALELNELARN